MTEWDNNFLNLAKTVSNFSKDPSTKVGAVIVDENNRLVSIGYNGFPRGILDDDRLLNRKIKYEMVVHAEANAILFAKTSLFYCTIYTYPFMPCSRCTGLIIQSWIERVVSIKNNEERWKENFLLSSQMMREAGVTLDIY